MHLSAQSWKQFFFYGEVVGFLMAWLLGAAVLSQPETSQPRVAEVESLAASSDLRRTDSGGSSELK